MGRRVVSVCGAMLALVVVLAACGAAEEEVVPTVTRIPDAANAPVLTPAQGSPTPAAGTAVAVGGATASPGTIVAGTPEAAGSPAAANFVIVSRDILFEPAVMTIAAESDVTISLPNEGFAPHNFSIDELEISVDLAPGETKEVVINAPAGEYEFYCNVPGHREAGMVGTLTVE